MKNITINYNSTIQDAIIQMSKYGLRCLIVSNNKNQFEGTLSDGDIRKSLIKGSSISDKINQFYSKKSFFFYENSYTEKIIKELFQKKKLDIIPVVNKNKVVVKVFFPNFLNSKKNKYIKINTVKNTGVIIMAGGTGTRMMPFSSILPKPLLIYKQKTLLENIMDNFSEYGLNDFKLSINYKSKLIKSYFSEINLPYKLSFIEEEEKLGTIGALQLIKEPKYNDYFVINCDTLINTNLYKIHKYHKTKKNDLTIVVADFNIRIPYGVCYYNKNYSLKKISEKPEINYKVNSGLYLINSDLIKLIPKNYKIYNFDNFVKTLKKNKKKIGIYIIDENSWKDLGALSRFNLDKIKI
jgi:dTDP-glucose pyrophosphorylase/predicted transcriptional regulator